MPQKKSKTIEERLAIQNQDRVFSFRDRQLALGRERKEFYVTPKEHTQLKEYLGELRE